MYPPCDAPTGLFEHSNGLFSGSRISTQVSSPAVTRPIVIDPSVVARGFNNLTPRSDWVSKYFYAHLFRHHPELRSLFPAKMDLQRDRFVGAMIEIVGNIANFDDVTGYLERLGRGHQRHLGVKPEHYPAVGDSLIATLRHLNGAIWTDEIERNWIAAYQLMATVMIAAADQAEDPREPAEADIVPITSHRATRRGLRDASRLSGQRASRLV